MNIIKVIAIFLFAFQFTSCSEEAEEPLTKNGFKIADKFYPTPYGLYARSGGADDYEFNFSDKKIEKAASGDYQYVGIAGSTLNAFVIADLTLKSPGEFIGEYFYDPTESIPLGVDHFGYFTDQQFDNSGNPVGSTTSIKVVDGNVKIIAQSGHTFEIEYQATFDNGVTVAG